MRFAAALAVLSILVPTAALAANDRQVMEALFRRPPASIEPLMSVKGDDLDPVVTVTSNGVTSIKRQPMLGLLGSYDDKNAFLRAFIDRKTGSVSAQIYHTIHYFGDGWNFYRTGTYVGQDGVVQVDLDQIGSNVDCGRYGCSYDEVIGLPIPFAVLEDGASKYDAAQPLNGLKFRLFAKSGRTVDGVIPANELVAFVNVVHRRGGKANAATPEARVAEPPKPQVVPKPAPEPAVTPTPAPRPTRRPPAASQLGPHVRCLTCRSN